MRIERSVPRHRGERREGDRCSPRSVGPGPHTVDEGAPDALALVVRVHADLLEVRVVIHDVGDGVTDGAVAGMEGDPAPPGQGVTGEGVDGGGLGVGDIAQADLAEARTGDPLDLPQGRPVERVRAPDDDRHAQEHPIGELSPPIGA